MRSLLLKAGVLGICLMGLANGPAAAEDCVAPLENLSLWLPLDADANDLISLQQGVLSGSPAFAAGKVAQGLAFDGAEDAIRMSASSGVDIGDGPGLTIEMWMNPQDVASPMTLLEWSGPDGSQLGLHFVTSVLGSGTLFANLIDTGNVSHHIATAGGLLSQGEFQHVALTYDRNSGQAKIFRNGLEVAQANFGNLRLETRAGLWIGKRVVGTTGHYYFAGIMDEVSLYNRALSQAELQSIVEAGASGKCKTPVPPSIVTQPASQTVLAGASASFSVSANGTAPLTYQWLSGEGQPVSGATNSILTFSSATTNDAGAYQVIVQNAVGSVTSLVATLTVNLLAPGITTQPSSQSVLVGASVSFSVSAEGTAPLSYQWLFEGGPIDEATNSVLALASVGTMDAGGYSVIVQNAAGSVTSLVATLTVNLAPPCLPPPVGLAGWWPFEQNGDDLVGAGTAAFTGGPVFIAGKVGNALWLDGVNDTASVAANAQLNVGAADDGFTIEGWIKPGSVGQQALVEWNNRAGTAGVHLYLGQNGPLGGGAGSLYANLVDVNNSSHRMTSVGGLVSPEIWQHVALTYDKSNGVTTIYVNGASVAQQNLGSFTAQTGPGFDLLFGHRIAGGVQFPYKGGMDEMGIYARALGASEIQALVDAGTSGKCNTGFPPQIVAGPRSQTVVRGSTVVFNVGASGTAPLFYQWFFNDSAIEGATTSTLTLNGVQLNQSGNYSVVVSNAVGTAASGNAVLVVNPPPAIVRVVSANGAGAAEVSVPVEIVANGIENALGFSLNFNANVLGFVGASLGAGAPSGAALLVNTNDVTAGRLGLVVGLPADETLSEGTQQVAVVTFLVAPILNQTTETVSFGDQPTLRQLSDVQARVLPALFVGGTVSIADSQFEGDVAPRPEGNRSVTTVDWVQMGRYVARLDTISGPNEFLRADCAPRSTKGNGKLSVSDWVQAGRYAVGLDPLTVLGGPTEGDAGGEGGFAAAASAGRQLCLVNTSIAQGQTNVVPVTLECQGNENAASFSVVFDPAKLAFVSAVPGAGSAGGLLNLNMSEIAEGRLGVAMAAQPGATFTAGVREVLQLRFAALVSAPSTTTLQFGNAPVPREVSDVVANVLAADYTMGTVSVTLPPGPPLSIARAGNSVVVTWPSSATGFELEATEGGFGTAWKPVVGVITLEDQKLAIVNLDGGERYFRLKKP